MAHWYNPLWDPGTTKDPGFQTQLCASETPASPSPLSLIDLGVPSADNLSGQIRCCASKEKKQLKGKLLSILKSYFSVASFAAALKKVKVIVYAQVHRSGTQEGEGNCVCPGSS
jgi:hypothetical protein